jgi:hypothetical protein
VSTLKDKIQEIEAALQALDNRLGRDPLSAEDAYLCALLTSNAGYHTGRIAATLRRALLPTASGQNPTSNRFTTGAAGHAHDLLLSVARACEDAHVAGGDTADCLRKVASISGFVLTPKTP